MDASYNDGNLCFAYDQKSLCLVVVYHRRGFASWHRRATGRVTVFVYEQGGEVKMSGDTWMVDKQNVRR